MSRLILNRLLDQKVPWTMDSDGSIESGSSDESDTVGVFSNSAMPSLSGNPPLRTYPKPMGPVYVQSQMSKTSTVTSAGNQEFSVGQGVKKESSSDGKVMIVSTPKGLSSGPRPGTIVPNGAFSGSRKVVPVSSSSNVSYLGAMGVLQNDKKERKMSTHKVILASLKGKSNEYSTRILVPANQTPAVSTSTTVSPSSAPGIGLMLPQSHKQVSKGYIVSPGAVGPRGTVSILPRNNAVYIDAQGQQKMLSPNLLKTKDGRIINASSLRPLGVLTSTTGGKMISSTLPSTYNLIAVPSKTRPSLVSNKQVGLSDKKLVVGSQCGQLGGSQSNQVIVASSDDGPKTYAPITKFQISPNGKKTILKGDSQSNHKADSTSDSEEVVSSPTKFDLTNTTNAEAITRGTSENTEDSIKNCAQKNSIDNKKAGNEPRPKKKLLVDEVVTIEDDLAEEPVEKVPALRKAKILTCSKAKAKAGNSLLNGIKNSPKLESMPIDIPLIGSKNVTSLPERVRKRKDNHKPAATGEPPQKVIVRNQQNLKLITTAEGRDPLKVIKWDSDGVGLLPGSSLKFTFNDYGMLEVHEDLLSNKVEFYRDTKDDQLKVKRRDPSEIYCCSVCSCYGLLSEFFNENFCSISCWETLTAQQESIIQKMEEEPTPPINFDAELNKRKRMSLVDEEMEAADEPLPPLKKVSPDLSADDEDSNSSSVDKKNPDVGGKMKKPPVKTDKVESSSHHKPFIKVRSMESLTGSPGGRQLRIRDGSATPQKKVKHIPGQDLEGLPLVDDEKVRGDEIDPFCWSDYLQKTNSKPAWIKLFNIPLPTQPNPFKIGFKLEAIDPERQGVFGAATIADVQGLRIKVHFDGFANKYDFWTNISSFNIFPCGFCEQHQIPLQPPAGIKKRLFNWQQYNLSRKTRPAPLSWFQNHQLSSSSTNMFRTGMKLEAVDKKNTQLTCVASVAGVIDNRILVHFDSWSDVYDYWVETSSPYIHPVGWCVERNREITPPNGYTSSNFVWEKYLAATNSEAAPTAAFTLRPPIEFKRGTKLEAIDKRSSHLLRVATIKDVLPYQIKLSFDGFPDHFGYWCDDDSPDIHPINWGLKTGHPIAGPPEMYQIASSKCPTPGCIGDGNYFGLASEFHSIVEECPYSEQHLNAESPLQDRLSTKVMSRKDRQSSLHTLGHNSDSDNELDLSDRWNFLDAAVVRSTPKGRILPDGSMVKLKSTSTPQSLTKTPVPNCKVGNAVPASKAKSSTEKVKTSVSSGKRPKKPLERRSSDKNLPVGSRLRHQPPKSTTGIQAGSPMKNTRVSVNANESVEKAKKSNIFNSKEKIESPDSGIDVLDRIRSKVSSDDSQLKSDHNVMFWTAQQCLDRIRILGPTIHSMMMEKDLDGEKMLMMAHSDVNCELSASESKPLLSFICNLQTKATVGLDSWRKVDKLKCNNI